MESSGDVNTLEHIIELITDTEDPKVVSRERTFTQNELDTSLISACRRGYTFLVFKIAHRGADVHTRDRNGNTLLLICVKHGFTNIAKFLIRKNVDINASNNFGDTALILATSLANSVEMVKLFLAQTRINVHHQNKKGYTALMKAVEARNVDVIKLLLDFTNKTKFFIRKKVDLNASNDVGDTALILAAGLANSVEMVKLLLAHTGINVNHQNKEGYTALMKAIEARNVDVIKLLLDSQENTTEGLTEIKNCRNETAQDIADKLGIGSAVKFLKGYRSSTYNPLLAAVLMADVMASFSILVDRKACEPFVRQFIIQDSFRAMFATHEMSRENFNEDEDMIIQKLLECGADVNDCPDSSHPILVATKVGSCRVLKMFLKHGASLRGLLTWTQTSLLTIPTEQDQDHIKAALLKHKYNLRCDAAYKNKYETVLKHSASNNDSCSGSPLMIALLNRANKNIIQLLLDLGADFRVKDSKGNTVLLVAAENNSTETIGCLLQYRKVRNLINEINYEGLTALMISVCNNNHSAVKLLIDYGADLNTRGVAGNTALMFAVSNHLQNLQMLVTLAYAGCDVSCQNYRGRSPLMLAAYTCWEDALIFLVDSGADVNAVSGSNETALSLTMKNTNLSSSCVEYLLDHGARASYVKCDDFLRLIPKKHLQLIPKLMKCGLGPTEILTEHSPFDCTTTTLKTVSPLCVALMTGNVKLASYFVENLFVTKSNMFQLVHDKDLRLLLHTHKLHECLGFLDKQAAQPLSLFSLAFITVQTAISAAPGREERVSKLPLPQIIKDRLMFKVETMPLICQLTLQ